MRTWKLRTVHLQLEWRKPLRFHYLLDIPSQAPLLVPPISYSLIHPQALGAGPTHIRCSSICCMNVLWPLNFGTPQGSENGSLCLVSPPWLFYSFSQSYSQLWTYIPSLYLTFHLEVWKASQTSTVQNWPSAVGAKLTPRVIFPNSVNCSFILVATWAQTSLLLLLHIQSLM